ncbi:MAG: hypothetical protein AAFZ18_08230 [Myxococcota bacterium]
MTKNHTSAHTHSDDRFGADLVAASKAGWAFMPNHSRASLSLGGFFAALERGLAHAAMPMGGLPAGRGPRLER